MSCRSARERLFAAADGRLSVEEELELDAHVHACERCTRLARSLARLETALVRVPEPPLESIDVGAHVRAVRRAIDARAEPRRRAPVRRWLPLAAAAAAITFVVIVVATRARDADDGAPDVVDATRDAGSPAERELGAPPRLAHDANAAPDAAPSPDGSSHPRGSESVPHVEPEIAHEPAPSANESATPLDVGAQTTAELASAAPPPWTAAEVERWTSARGELGRALEDALAAARERTATELAAEFTARTRELARAGWPVARIAEGLAAQPDRDVARAAVRYLGLHGDRTNVRALERALATPELQGEAVLALADLGPNGGDVALDALLRLDPASCELAFARIVASSASSRPATSGASSRPATSSASSQPATSSASAQLADSNVRPNDAARDERRAARLLENFVRRAVRENAPRADATRRSEPSPSAALPRLALAALARTGAPAVDSMLRLAADDSISVDDALAHVQVVPAAADALARILERTPRDLPAELLLAAVERLRPVNGPVWLAARAVDERDLRAACIAVLARWDDASAVRALLALRGSGRVDEATLALALDGLVERAPLAAAELVELCARARDRDALQRLVAEFTLRANAASVPALLALAACELVPRSDRKTAELEAGELAGAEDTALFAAHYRALDARERELRATCLVALHRLGGESAVRALFVRAPSRALERVLALLAAPDAKTRPATTSIRLAQELDALEARGTP